MTVEPELGVGVGVAVAVTFSVHLAYSVMLPVMAVLKSKAVVQEASLNQPPKVHPLSAGSAGFVALLPLSTVCAAGAVPWPLALKVTVYVIGTGGVTLSSVHLAYSVRSLVMAVLKSNAVVQAASLNQLPKVHPVSAGSAGLVALLPLSTVCAAGAVP